ncbi:MAG: flagellar motor switch protein FliN [Planctomycetota bacterium]|nr:flagellar motor switch protein FliN [Planctomycetota bacterium]
MAETKPKPGPTATNDTDKIVAEALSQAKDSISELQATAESVSGSPMEMPDLGGGVSGGAGAGDIELLSDVDLEVSIELGRTQMLVEDVLRLNEGSVVELDKLAGDPVDVYVNHRLVARGEVLVVNDNFCIRISEIVADLEEQAEQAAESSGEGG